MKTEPESCANSEDLWSCMGAIDLDRRNLLVFWESSWHSPDEYHALCAGGNRGWLVHARGDDQLLIAWEPTIESKSVQASPRSLVYDPVIEVRRDRPGLLGYVASKTLRGSGKARSRRLAFLAYWKVAPMTRGLFFYLQKTFSSHRGCIVHADKDRVWVQWEPTWVLYDDLGEVKKKQLLKEPAGALENVFNSNLDVRAPDSKFAAIFERLKAKEELWIGYEPGKEYWPVARLNFSKSRQYKQGAEGYYYILRSKFGDLSKDFWVVAHQTCVKRAWHRYLRHPRSGSCTQKTIATSFFHAACLEKDGRYSVREVSGIGNYNNYVTIRQL
ncbi:unnamed protein product [Alternaria alternata]